VILKGLIILISGVRVGAGVSRGAESVERGTRHMQVGDVAA